MLPCGPRTRASSRRPRRPRPSGRTAPPRKPPVRRRALAPGRSGRGCRSLAPRSRRPAVGRPSGRAWPRMPVSPHGNSPAWACSTASASVAGAAAGHGRPAKNAPAGEDDARPPPRSPSGSGPGPLRIVVFVSVGHLSVLSSSAAGGRVLSVPRRRRAARRSRPGRCDAVAMTELATTVPLAAVWPVTITVSPGWISPAPATALRVTLRLLVRLDPHLVAALVGHVEALAVDAGDLADRGVDLLLLAAAAGAALEAAARRRAATRPARLLHLHAAEEAQRADQHGAADRPRPA